MDQWEYPSIDCRSLFSFFPRMPQKNLTDSGYALQLPLGILYCVSLAKCSLPLTPVGKSGRYLFDMVSILSVLILASLTVFVKSSAVPISTVTSKTNNFIQTLTTADLQSYTSASESVNSLLRLRGGKDKKPIKEKKVLFVHRFLTSQPYSFSLLTAH